MAEDARDSFMLQGLLLLMRGLSTETPHWSKYEDLIVQRLPSEMTLDERSLSTSVRMPRIPWMCFIPPSAMAKQASFLFPLHHSLLFAAAVIHSVVFSLCEDGQGSLAYHSFCFCFIQHSSIEAPRQCCCPSEAP